MSHDEINHVVPSYEYSQGRGYAYNPMTHGPLQFHLIALSYFLLGDDDFTSRIPAALFSVATVGVALFGFRRFLGRVGALAAGLLLVISPYLLFYGRYARNEAFIVLWGLLTLYAILRYLERGERGALALFAAVNALHFTDKATAYIFAAEELLFLLGYFLYQVGRREWAGSLQYRRFLLGLLAAVTGWTLAGGLYLLSRGAAPVLGRWAGGLALALGLAGLAGVGAAAVFLVRGLGWGGIRRERSLDLIVLLTSLILPLLAALPVKLAGFDPLDYSQPAIVRGAAALAILLIPAAGLGLWWRWREWPLYAGLFYAIYLVLFTSLFSNPSGLAVGLFGALGYWMAQQGVERGTQPLYYYLLLQIPLYEFLPFIGALLAAGIGWRKRLWVARPGRPFLPAASSGVQGLACEDPAASSGAEVPLAVPAADAATPPDLREQPVPTLALLLFWSLSSLAAFTLAGERMPWLTTHITLPLILSAAWAIGYLVETLGAPLCLAPRVEAAWATHHSEAPRRPGAWHMLLRNRSHAPNALADNHTGGEEAAVVPMRPSLSSESPGLKAAGLKKRSQILQAIGPVFLALGLPAQGTSTDHEPDRRVRPLWPPAVLADNQPGRGQAHAPTERPGWSTPFLLRIAALCFLFLLAVLTARAAYRAAFVLYDDPLEYLVYAHSAPDPKRVLGELETLSRRTAGGLEIVVAYDNNARYPYWWYLRHYPNRIDYDVRPTRGLRKAAVIFVGTANNEKIEPILRQDYLQYDYSRMWWPNEDYRALSWSSIEAARPPSANGQPLPPLTEGEYLRLAARQVWAYLRDPVARDAFWQIWLNRNYQPYAQWQHKDSLALTRWDPADRMRMYVRKDIAAKAWGGLAPGQTIVPPADPYEHIQAALSPQRTLGSGGAASGQFQAPRGLALGADGSLYVADSRNHRIQRFAPDGTVLSVWGIFADISKGDAPGGTFNEPWGVAVGPDGSVYVSDTWNHRVQKFTAEGEFLRSWGNFGQAKAAPGVPPDSGDSFYGPRGIAVDGQGRVYVADTGNKRIVVFDADGSYLTQFGEPGSELGQLDEPVGVAVSASGLVYVTDTWNQRVQVFAPDPAGKSFTFRAAWPVDGWYGRGVENKPFIAAGPGGQVSISDPQNCQVLQFDPDGTPIHLWGDCGAGLGTLSGLVADAQGGLWVADAQNNKVLYFKVYN
jgi:DNA-binding beta-propeller fold protein YncE